MDINKLGKELAKIMKDLGEIELENVDLVAENLELQFLPQLIATTAKQLVAPEMARKGLTLKDFEWEATKFEIPYQKYTQKIEEIEFV
ncbi:MAG: hypothetical protein ACTSRA_03015, partial [Promethearchaeota archaeon]